MPKITLGRLQVDGEGLWGPFSVEMHHALLMSGLHLGRYVQAVDARLWQREPRLSG